MERDLRGPNHYKEILKKGSPDDRRLFERQFSVNVCGPFVKDPFCSPHPELVRGDTNSTMWPDGMTEKTLENLRERLAPEKYAAVMSNYTVVEGEGDDFKTTSFVKFEPYKKVIGYIAREFEAISKIDGIDESSRKTAKAYAEACLGKGKNPLRPFDEAERVWATNPAPVLTFSFGPFEEQGELDQFGVKRGWQMVIYRVREDMTQAIERDRPLIAKLNAFLRERKIPVPQEVTKRQTIHIADALTPTSSMSDGHMSAIAQTIPNDGPVVEEFGRRVDVSANIAEVVFDKVMIPIRDRIMAPDQRQYVKRDMMAKFAELHELAHSSGYLQDHKITRNGKTTTVSDAMGGMYFLLDEGKSNAGAVAGISALGTYSADDIRDFYITYVDNLARQIRLSPDDPHTWGARAELGSLFKQGATELREYNVDGRREKFLYVNVNKMQSAMQNFYAELVEVQAGGDRGKAKAFIKRDTVHIPEELQSWVAYPYTTNGRLNNIPITVIGKPSKLGD